VEIISKVAQYVQDLFGSIAEKVGKTHRNRSVPGPAQ
jgi:hypothetical protein